MTDIIYHSWYKNHIFKVTNDITYIYIYIFQIYIYIYQDAQDAQSRLYCIGFVNVWSLGLFMFEIKDPTPHLCFKTYFQGVNANSDVAFQQEDSKQTAVETLTSTHQTIKVIYSLLSALLCHLCKNDIPFLWGTCQTTSFLI